MGRKDKRRRRVVDPLAQTVVATDPAAPAAVASAPSPVKKRLVVIPRRGIMGWVAVEEMPVHPDWAAEIERGARVIRAAVGDEWRRDVPGAGDLAPAAFEVAAAALLLGICPQDPEVGLPMSTVLTEGLGLVGLPELLEGDSAVRDPLFGTFADTPSDMVDALWALAEAEAIASEEAEAACRFLARAALARFKAGGAAKADMNGSALRCWFRNPGEAWPHARAFGLAEAHLHLGQKAAALDWKLFGHLRPVRLGNREIVVAVCHSPSPFLADWLFANMRPHVVLRLEAGGFWCRVSRRSDARLWKATEAWRLAVLGRPPTPEEAVVLCEEGRPFGTPIELSEDGCTAGNRILANPHLPAVNLPADQLEDLLIRSLTE